MSTHIEFIRSLGAGGMIGSATFGLFFAIFPDLFGGEVTLRQITILGALAGAGGHRLIEGLFKSILAPPARFAAYYAKLVQLALLRSTISYRLRRRIIDELTERYFLD